MSAKTQRIERGDVSRTLEGKTAPERAALKADAFTKASLPTQFEHDGITIRVLEGPVRDGAALRVTLAASQGGKPVELNNPFLFVNPPVLVPDGTVDAHGQRNLKEDLAAAWQIMLGQAVAGSLARRRGR